MNPTQPVEQVEKIYFPPYGDFISGKDLTNDLAKPVPGVRGETFNEFQDLNHGIVETFKLSETFVFH